MAEVFKRSFFPKLRSSSYGKIFYSMYMLFSATDVTCSHIAGTNTKPKCSLACDCSFLSLTLTIEIGVGTVGIGRACPHRIRDGLEIVSIYL